MTYGAFRLVLRKLAPGVDIELLDNWTQNRYSEILDKLPWKRIESDIVISAPPSFRDGTVATTQGSNAILTNDSTWSTALDGRAIRIADQHEYYQFTNVDPTHATLDRVYEAPSGSDLAYRIDQNIFVLPANCRVLRGVKPMHGIRPLIRMTPHELNSVTVSRNDYGSPAFYVPTWDNFSDPPRMQFELFPVPSVPDSGGSLLSFVADCILDAAALDPDGSSNSLLPWVRPQALEAGVSADIARHLKDWTGAEAYEARYNQLVSDMAQINAQQLGSQQIKLGAEYRRGPKNRYPHGPRHEGWPA